jgi:hypothetical protein
MSSDTPPVVTTVPSQALIGGSAYFYDSPVVRRQPVRVHSGGDIDTLWYPFDVDSTTLDAAVEESIPSPAEIFTTFVQVHGLESALQVCASAAKSAFRSDHVRVDTHLDSDEDLGGDFVHIRIVVSGRTRDEFRAGRRAFDAELAKFNDPAAFSRIVTSISRAAE